jgi:hypothetical protein
MLAALIATSLVALAASAGLLGARDPGKNVAGVPDVSRTLMQQATAEQPEAENFRLLAYSRRADELLRLRELPTPPARAVVEYAERASAKANEAASEPVAPPAGTEIPETDVASAPEASSPPAAKVVTAPVTDAAAPTGPASDPPVPAAPAAAISVEPPADPAARDDATRVANVQSGAGETASVNPPDAPYVSTKPHRHARAHRRPQGRPAAQARPKPVATRGPLRVPPSGPTGFPIDPPQGSSEARAIDNALNIRLRADR